MRPKKVILCVDEDEQRLSRRVFLLETRGYRVLRAAGAAEALNVLAALMPGCIDCLITDLTLALHMSGNELVRRAKRMAPELKTVVTSDTVSGYDPTIQADVFLPKGANTPAELLERVRILIVRKRGPKKACPSEIAAIHASAGYRRLLAEAAAQGIGRGDSLVAELPVPGCAGVSVGSIPTPLAKPDVQVCA
jgi:two-component system response regulator CpxR